MPVTEVQVQEAVTDLIGFCGEMDPEAEEVLRAYTALRLGIESHPQELQEEEWVGVIWAALHALVRVRTAAQKPAFARLVLHYIDSELESTAPSLAEQLAHLQLLDDGILQMQQDVRRKMEVAAAATGGIC